MRYSYKANPTKKVMRFEKIRFTLKKDGDIFDKDGKVVDKKSTDWSFESSLRIGKYFKIDTLENELFVDEALLFDEYR